jgi:isocitrate lyase
VLVSVDEQIKRLNAARLQLDIMRVPGIIVARTDAESATFIESRSDERDQPFILGATNVDLPSYKAGYLAILRKLYELGVDEVRGHCCLPCPRPSTAAAYSWLERIGLMSIVTERAPALRDMTSTELDAALDKIDTRYVETWQSEAGMKTYALAVAEVLEFRASEGEHFEMTVDEWLAFAKRASFYEARERAKSMGVHVIWNCEHPKDARRLLSPPGRNRFRHRQVAGRRSLRRPSLDGDQDRRSR